jgi:hypothetical protein
MVERTGDPGDGSESASSGGGYGASSDGESGDPTDGNGWAAKQVDMPARGAGNRSAGDPGDGEEGSAVAVADASAPDGWPITLWKFAALILGRR